MLQILSSLLTLLGPVGKFFTGIDVNALLSYAGNVLQALWASVVKYWQYYLIGLLAAGNILSYHEWQTTKGQLALEKASHATDVATFKQAQADALARAEAQKKALIAVSEAKANAADQSYSALYAEYRANLLRYKADTGKGSGPVAGEHSDPAQSVDGPSSGTVVPPVSGTITITAEDANICAVNTARLQTAHDWALKLKDSINASN